MAGRQGGHRGRVGDSGRAQPIRVGGKWTAVVLRCLEDGLPRRFSELRVPLHWITLKVLTETLRAMERDGFLTRTAYDENPPRVEYALTSLGRSLIDPLARFRSDPGIGSRP
ncbi:winged helix-turn-helix transcriptional regulator [Streptomyces sp. NPDC017254]|uniref:winged helix-turn-helix transcriptional regulator n=1 Tax=unclassified Streptomyces TaxID=2593676 RepID=UPI003788C031